MIDEMEEKIKILWISPRVPSKTVSHAGGQTFYYYFSNFVNDKSFEVKLICSDEDLDEGSNEVLSICDNRIVHKNVSIIKKVLNVESKFNPWNRHAGLLSNYFAGNMLKFCKELYKEGFYPDFIILEWTAAVLLAREVKTIFPNSMIVASEHDVTFFGYDRKRKYYTGFNRLLWEHKYKWEMKLELSSLRFCDLILPQNPEYIDKLVEFGISVDKFMWLSPYFNNMESCVRKPNGKDILFYGAMARPENHLSALWFINSVMPLINDLDVRFVVLGSNPKPELRVLESDRVHITGFVKDVVPYFENSICLVSPLVLGAGIKVKILEGFSSGIPVITNDIGIEGIPAEANLDYYYCKTPEEYAKAIRKAYIGDLEGIGFNGQKFLKENYNLESIYRKYRSRLTTLYKNRKDSNNNDNY